MALWRQVCKAYNVQSSSPVIINHTFKKSLLIVRATCRNQKLTWRVAGTLMPTLNLPGIGFVEGFSEEIKLETQQVKFRHLGGSQYRLKLLMPKWLPEISLVFWEDFEMPSYSLDDPTPTNLAASSTKNVTTVTVAATPTRLLLANNQRKDVKFYSADKIKTVYLDTDNVVSASSAVESVTPNRPVCVPTIKWQGEWWGLSSSGTVTIEIEEYF